MISNELLKKKILEKAFHGLLVSNKENLHKVNFQNTYQGDYNIPNNWCWIKYEDIADSKMGKTILAKDLVDNGIPVYSATQSDKIFGYVKDSNILLNKGDIVIPARGNSIGCATLITEEKATCTQTTIYSKIKNKEILPKYLLYCCKYFKEVWFKYSGAAIPQVTVKQINQNLVPVAPIEEQKEIVEKIDSLYKLIDKKEQNDQEKNKLKETLKNKILEEAIHGTLIDNDLSLKPVDVKEMINDIPFEIPSNWKWSTFKNITTLISDGTHKTPKYVKEGVPFLSVKDMNDGKLHFENTKFITEDEYKLLNSRCNPEKEDLLITKVGTTGIPVIVDTDKKFSLFVSVALLKFDHNKIYNKYLYYAVYSKLIKDQVDENTRGAANKNWVIKDIEKTIIPIPPLEQQKKIVYKIEELFNLINQL